MADDVEELRREVADLWAAIITLQTQLREHTHETDPLKYGKVWPPSLDVRKGS